MTSAPVKKVNYFRLCRNSERLGTLSKLLGNTPSGKKSIILNCSAVPKCAERLGTLNKSPGNTPSEKPKKSIISDCADIQGILAHLTNHAVPMGHCAENLGTLSKSLGNTSSENKKVNYFRLCRCAEVCRKSRHTYKVNKNNGFRVPRLRYGGVGVIESIYKYSLTPPKLGQLILEQKTNERI